MSACKQCGLDVVWKKDPKSGHLQCFNPDGSVHWDRCSQARTARIKATGTPFSEKRGGLLHEGYRTPFKKSGELLTRYEGITIQGPKFRTHTACHHCVLAWELCPNGCPIEFRAAT